MNPPPSILAAPASAPPSYWLLTVQRHGEPARNLVVDLAPVDYICRERVRHANPRARNVVLYALPASATDYQRYLNSLK